MQRPQWRNPFFFVHTHLIFACWAKIWRKKFPIKDLHRSWGDHCLSLLCRSRVAVVGTPARVNAPSAHCGHAMMLGQCYTLLQRNPEQLSCIGAVLKPSQHWELFTVCTGSTLRATVDACAVQNCQSSAPWCFFPAKRQNTPDFCPNKTSRITKRNGGQFLSERPEKEERLDRRFLPISEAFHSEVQI